MGDYWTSFRRETPLLTYGVLLTLVSSVGQTFLVSLFVPDFLAIFSLDEGSFGLLYSGATLSSGLLLPWIGKWLDRKPLDRFTVGVLALLAADVLLVAPLATALLGASGVQMDPREAVLGRVGFTLGTGEWVDRLSARMLFPLTVLPMGLGIGALWALDAGWVGYLFMALLGVTSRMNASVKTALGAELYGTGHLGAIKSMLASLTVISTSAPPRWSGSRWKGGGLTVALGAGVGSVVASALLALWTLADGLHRQAASRS